MCVADVLSFQKLEGGTKDARKKGISIQLRAVPIWVFAFTNIRY